MFVHGSTQTPPAPHPPPLRDGTGDVTSIYASLGGREGDPAAQKRLSTRGCISPRHLAPPPPHTTANKTIQLRLQRMFKRPNIDFHHGVTEHRWLGLLRRLLLQGVCLGQGSCALWRWGGPNLAARKLLELARSIARAPPMLLQLSGRIAPFNIRRTQRSTLQAPGTRARHKKNI